MKTNQFENKFDRNVVYESDASQLSVNGGISKVFIPTSVSEISMIVKANDNITVRGGGSGFSGGAVPENNGVVIDMQKMSHILDFDERRKIVEVEAGMSLDSLNHFLDKHNLEFPILPHSRKICTIGGMIANNSFGIFSAKYGNMIRWVESVKIVNSQGVFEEKGKVEVSDFAGLEGTTGVIVSAKLKTIERKQRTYDIARLKDLEKVKNLISDLKLRSDICMTNFLDKNISKMFGFGENYTLIIGYESLQGTIKDRDSETILREVFEIYPKLLEEGYCIEDIKVYPDRSPEIFSFMEEEGIPFFGDFSFGNVHPCLSLDKMSKLEELIKLTRKRGKISAGFGIGLKKKRFLEVLDKNIYIAVKKRNDPLNKFNPNKIVDSDFAGVCEEVKDE